MPLGSPQNVHSSLLCSWDRVLSEPRQVGQATALGAGQLSRGNGSRKLCCSLGPLVTQRWEHSHPVGRTGAEGAGPGRPEPTTQSRPVLPVRSVGAHHSSQKRGVSPLTPRTHRKPGHGRTRAPPEITQREGAGKNEKFHASNCCAVDTREVFPSWASTSCFFIVCLSPCVFSHHR